MITESISPLYLHNKDLKKMISLSRENNIYILEEMMCLAASCSGLLYSLTEFNQKQQITRTSKERREKKEVNKEENRREKWKKQGRRNQGNN